MDWRSAPGSNGLTSGVRSGGFFFSACLAPGSTGEFMAAAPKLPTPPLATHRTAHSPHVGVRPPYREGTPHRCGVRTQANKPSQCPPRASAHARLARKKPARGRGKATAHAHHVCARQPEPKGDIRTGAVRLRLFLPSVRFRLIARSHLNCSGDPPQSCGFGLFSFRCRTGNELTRSKRKQPVGQNSGESTWMEKFVSKSGS